MSAVPYEKFKVLEKKIVTPKKGVHIENVHIDGYNNH